jgi:hypothetical protein
MAKRDIVLAEQSTSVQEKRGSPNGERLARTALVLTAMERVQFSDAPIATERTTRRAKHTSASAK